MSWVHLISWDRFVWIWELVVKYLWWYIVCIILFTFIYIAYRCQLDPWFFCLQVDYFIYIIVCVCNVSVGGFFCCWHRSQNPGLHPLAQSHPYWRSLFILVSVVFLAPSLCHGSLRTYNQNIVCDMCICIYIYIYIHMCVCMYVCIHIYDVTTYINSWLCRFMAENGINFFKPMGLTHWDRDKMAATSQTTLSNTFSWMKMLEFRWKFHWSLCLRVQ